MACEVEMVSLDWRGEHGSQINFIRFFFYQEITDHKNLLGLIHLKRTHLTFIPLSPPLSLQQHPGCALSWWANCNQWVLLLWSQYGLLVLFSWDIGSMQNNLIHIDGFFMLLKVTGRYQYHSLKSSALLFNDSQDNNLSAFSGLLYS